MLLMAKVQQCSWNTFKLHEIVTLEKCLREALGEGPKISNFIRKLESECFFVEEERKKKFLARDTNVKRKDSELMRKANILKVKIADLDEKLNYYKSKYEDLRDGEDNTKREIDSTSKLVLMMEEKCRSHMENFSLILERTMNSFETSIPIIKYKIPEFVSYLYNCEFLTQVDQLPDLHKNLLIEFIKNSADHHDDKQMRQFSYSRKTLIVAELKHYVELSSELLAILTDINQVYSKEVKQEVKSLQRFHAQLSYMEKPKAQDTPKKLSIRHHDLRPTDQPQISAGFPDFLLLESLEDSALSDLSNG